MSKHWLIKAAFGSACLVIASNQAFADPLTSWNAGATRSEIVDFVTTVSDETSDKFVPSEDRIAVFDIDGTLWVEKPLYT
ncbi:hypothetical protein [Ruegeria atlantica]|uniref:hypothetical protein n=1 Tax=Ruegeria atlantica TaxID=81569 RepID=UPI00249589ED|nr:hypothetical protein [Ruegeria atlantica]